MAIAPPQGGIVGEWGPTSHGYHVTVPIHLQVSRGCIGTPQTSSASSSADKQARFRPRARIGDNPANCQGKGPITVSPPGQGLRPMFAPAGFRIGFTDTIRLQSATTNMGSAREHPRVPGQGVNPGSHVGAF